MTTRRGFLAGGALAQLASASPAGAEPQLVPRQEISLDGVWQFRTDSQSTWRTVTVPHTWQIEPSLAEYYGVAYYRRQFHAAREWAACAVRIEFEAVFHSAEVVLNGALAGRHIGKGYTAFTCDLTQRLKLGAPNELAVRVDNSFSEAMLPRGRSSDWTHDGGIYRPVRLVVTPKVYIEHVAIDAALTGGVSARVSVRNTSGAAWTGTLHAAVETTSASADVSVTVPTGSTGDVSATMTIPGVRRWHFDDPHLYTLTVVLSNGDALSDTFGVRSIETRDGAFYLNGERVRLMGVERMAGSNPLYGMAEPSSWIEHDHDDMRNLNCIYTRVHWPQDRRVLDWCDRNGMLIQTEVPTWGPKTFEDMKDEPSPAIMQNGLEQLREMIGRDRSHPCIFLWGVCNEIGGQHPAASHFAKRMYDEAKRLDPHHLVTYASNSLQKTPEKDVAGLMDYIMWNEYYESWFGGTPADLARNLDEIHRAFPGKAIVISEYGYCACTADRPEGDGKRVDVLREHDRIFRERPWVAGLIFFCYNDYRTHIGDRGSGVLKQRVHGVVDLFGARKPSWAALREESSPVERATLTGPPAKFRVELAARNTVPAYTLRAYEVRAVAYGLGNIPVEQTVAPLPDTSPGSVARVDLSLAAKDVLYVRVDVLRPAGVSVWSGTWQH